MASIQPAVIQRVVRPGETAIGNFTIVGANGTLVARLSPDVEGIRLDFIQTQRTVVVEAPDEQMPGGLRPPQGDPLETEFVESVAAGEPIAVGGDLEVIGQISFWSFDPPATVSASTTLVVETSNGGRFTAPVNLFASVVRVEVPGQPIAAEINRTTRITARVSLPVGAPETGLVLSSEEGVVTIPPRSVTVAAGATVEVALNLHLNVSTAPGPLQAFLRVEGFAGGSVRQPFAVQAIWPAPPPAPVDPAQNFAAVDRYWRDHGANRGPLGFPLAEPQRVDDLFSRRFAGGTVESVAERVSVHDRQCVRVHFVGFRCLNPSSPFGAEEPYFAIGAAASNGSSTRLFGPYRNIFADSERTVAVDIASRDHALVPPVTVVIVGFEHDEGNPREVEDRVRDLVDAIPLKLADVRDPSGAEIDSHVVAEWLRRLGIGSIVEGMAALAGMGDDEIGRDVFVVHDDVPGVLERKRYPVIGNLRGADYTHVRGLQGSEGGYMIFLRVELLVEPS